MVSVPSGVRYSLGLAAVVALVISCAASGASDEGGVGGNCGPLPCPTGTKDSGSTLGDANTPTGDDDSGSVGDDDSSTGGDDSSTGDDDSGQVADSNTGNGGDTGGGNADASTGNWVDMTNNATGCDQKNGVACGWSATNNGVGDICACRRGDWADGWNCDSPTGPTVAGPSCPGVVTSGDSGTTTPDAGAHDAAVPDAAKPDSGTVTWIDVTATVANCNNHPTVPCGWSPTPNGAGYTCTCVNGTWADPWTCAAPGTTTVPGPGCP